MGKVKLGRFLRTLPCSIRKSKQQLCGGRGQTAQWHRGELQTTEVSRFVQRAPGLHQSSVFLSYHPCLIWLSSDVTSSRSYLFHMSNLSPILLLVMLIKTNWLTKLSISALLQFLFLCFLSKVSRYMCLLFISRKKTRSQYCGSYSLILPVSIQDKILVPSTCLLGV